MKRGRRRKWVIICKPTKPRGRPRKKLKAEPVTLPPLRAFRCKFYDQCLTAAAHSHNSLDCTGCTKREDRDIEDFFQLWKWLKLYACIYYPREFKEYSYCDAYRNNRETILGAANRYYREHRKNL